MSDRDRQHGIQMPVTEKHVKGDVVGMCFYCRSPVGEVHKPDCVNVRRNVRVRMTMEFEMDFPASWAEDAIDFHMNDSSWCASSILHRLKKLDEDPELGCLCPITEFEYLGESEKPVADD